jgi:hypothetical protein
MGIYLSESLEGSSGDVDEAGRLSGRSDRKGRGETDGSEWSGSCGRKGGGDGWFRVESVRVRRGGELGEEQLGG